MGLGGATGITTSVSGSSSGAGPKSCPAKITFTVPGPFHLAMTREAPTPSTLSTVMYCTGLDPRTMERVYVPTDPHEKAMQRALIQYRDPKNYALVREALVKAHREDLIGSGAKCLIRSAPPRPVRKKPGQSNGKRKPSK